MPATIRRRSDCRCRDSYGDLICGYSSYYDDSDCSCLCHGLRLMNYSATPPGGWQTQGTGPLFIGMECELTCYNCSQAIADVRDALGNLAILKSDGSVDGFEMVTQPCDYPFWQERFNWDVFDVIRPYTSVDPSTNGIHLHVSRSGFSSPAHVYRWMKLLYRNSAHVETIARRHSNHWSGFSPEHKKGQFQHVYKKAVKMPTLPAGLAYLTVQNREEYMSQFDMYGSRTRPVRSANRTYEVAVINIYESAERYSLDFVQRVSQNIYRDYADREWWCDSNSLIPYRVIAWNDLQHVSADDIAASDRWIYAVTQNSRRLADPTTATRYAAINTTNEHTYELRIFAAANTQLEVRSTVDFAAATVEYTRGLTSGQCARGGWDWNTFRSWVADSPYTSLADAMSRDVSWRDATFRPAPSSPAPAPTASRDLSDWSVFFPSSSQASASTTIIRPTDNR